jgi:demethylmenaquinone methyltransferase / 2-methoxy-6-polyprenyl-1,4-benzoquinol methylase
MFPYRIGNIGSVAYIVSTFSAPMARTQTTYNSNPALQRRTYETSYVQSLFNSIAHRYDVLNHILSSGIDILWRRRAIQLLSAYQPKTILDVATGTADLAIEASTLHPDSIIGIDISQKMLDIGTKKIQQRGLSSVITLQSGNAEALAFASDSFDIVTAAFGVRNFSNLEKGLSEFHRVLRSGGITMILEFSHPRRFPIKQFYYFYSKMVLPALGGIISCNRAAYDYLPSTVSEFPDGEQFCNILRSMGFAHVRCFPQTFEIATIYLAEKK